MLHKRPFHHVQRLVGYVFVCARFPCQGDLLLSGAQLKVRCDAGNDLTAFAQFIATYARCLKELGISPPAAWIETHKVAAARLKVDTMNRRLFMLSWLQLRVQQ